MKTGIAIRAVSSEDEHAFTSAALASKPLHQPWVTAPCDTEAFARYLKRFDRISNFGFVVYLPASSQLVGAINLSNVVYGIFRSGYLGYYAFTGHEQRGLMKSGLSAVIKYAFTDLRLHRLEANIQPGNQASIALARSCGFNKEGFSPAYLKIGGRWRDHERWALLRSRNDPT